MLSEILFRDLYLRRVFPEDGPVEVREGSGFPDLDEFLRVTVFSLGIVLGLEVVLEEFGNGLPEAGGGADFFIFDSARGEMEVMR